MISRIRRLLDRAVQTQFIKDASVLTGAQLLVTLLAFVQGVVVASWLGPANYGIALLIISIPSMMFGILDARTSAAAVKYLSEFKAEGSPARALAMCKLAYSLDFGIAAVVFLAVAAVAPWAQTRVVHSEGTAGLIVLFAAAYLPRALTGSSQSILTVSGNYRSMAIAQLVAKVVGLVSVLVLVWAGWGVRGVIFGRMAEITTLGVSLGVLAAGSARKAWGGSWLGSSFDSLAGRRREIFRFLGYTELTELAQVVTKQADVVILGYFGGPTEAGYYGLARRLTGFAGTIVEPLQSVLFPRLARYWAETDFGGLSRTLRRFVFGISLPLAGAIFLAIFIVGPFIHYVVGSEFDPAAPVSRIVFGSTACWVATCWVRPLFHAMGEVRFLFGYALVLNLASLAGFLLLAESDGAAGIGWVHLVLGGIVGPLVSVRFAFHRLNQARSAPAPAKASDATPPR